MLLGYGSVDGLPQLGCRLYRVAPLRGGASCNIGHAFAMLCLLLQQRHGITALDVGFWTEGKGSWRETVTLCDVRSISV